MTTTTSQLSRKELKLALFEAIDKDGDGCLKEGEMMQLAKLVGFDGNAQEWKQEYSILCKEVNVSQAKGVPKAVILKMLDDRSDTGCFCTDEELRLLLLSQPRPGAKRRKEEGADTKVRFRGASPGTSEDDLRQFFGKVGEIHGLNLFKLKDARSRGMGMVTYKTAEQAQQALLQLNGGKVQGCEIVVYTDHELHADFPKHPSKPSWNGSAQTQKFEPSHSVQGQAWFAQGPEWYNHSSAWEGSGSDGSTAVYFTGAPLDMGSDKLCPMFEECGKIKTFWLFSMPDGRSRGQGLVEYTSPQDARSAISYLNGWSINGFTLKVQEDRAGSRSAGMETWQASQSSWTNKEVEVDWWDGRSIFFSGCPSQLPVGKVQAYFQEYGALESFHMFRHPSGKPRGIGVVKFVDPHAATQILASGMQIEGWQLFLREADSRGERAGGTTSSPNQSWSSYQEDWSSGTDVDPGKSIFFANVPFESREIDLKRRFAHAGVINSFQLFRRQDGSSRGMGIVEYVTTAAARRACNTLSETDIDGRHVLIQPYRQGHSYGYS